MIKNYALLYIFFGMHLIQAMEITRERYPAETPPGSGICYLAMLPVEMRSNIAEYVRGGELEEKVKRKAQAERVLWFLANDLMKENDSKDYRAYPATTDGWNSIRVWRYDSTGDPEPAPDSSDSDSGELYSMVAVMFYPSLLGVKDTHYLVLNALHDRQCEQRVFSSLHEDRLIKQSQDDGLIKLADMPNPRCLYTVEYKQAIDKQYLVTRMPNEASVWVEKRRRELPAEGKYSSILVGTELEGVKLLREDGNVDTVKNTNYTKDHLFKLFARMGVFEGLEKLKNTRDED